MDYMSRNNTLEFAKRTLKNLEFIEQARYDGAKVHEVTQLVNSLLGLIVFPKEKYSEELLSKQNLEDLTNEGWPRIEMLVGADKCKTLADLIYYLRNSMAHYNVEFSSDSAERKMVAVTVKNYPHGDISKPPDWEARIPMEDVRTICVKFIDFLDQHLG